MTSLRTSSTTSDAFDENVIQNDKSNQQMQDVNIPNNSTNFETKSNSDPKHTTLFQQLRQLSNNISTNFETKQQTKSTILRATKYQYSGTVTDGVPVLNGRLIIPHHVFLQILTFLGATQLVFLQGRFLTNLFFFHSHFNNTYINFYCPSFFLSLYLLTTITHRTKTITH